MVSEIYGNLTTAHHFVNNENVSKCPLNLGELKELDSLISEIWKEKQT